MVFITSRFAALLAFCLLQTASAMPASPNVVPRTSAFDKYARGNALSEEDRFGHNQGEDRGESSNRGLDLVHELSTLVSDPTHHRFVDHMNGDDGSVSTKYAGQRCGEAVDTILALHARGSLLGGQQSSPPSKADEVIQLDSLRFNTKYHDYSDSVKDDSSIVSKYDGDSVEYHAYHEQRREAPSKADEIIDVNSLGLNTVYHTYSDRTKDDSSVVSKYNGGDGVQYHKYQEKKERSLLGSLGASPHKEDETVRLDSFGSDSTYHEYKDQGKKDSVVTTNYGSNSAQYHKYAEPKRPRAWGSRPQREDSLISVDTLGSDSTYHEYKEPGKASHSVETKFGETTSSLHQERGITEEHKKKPHHKGLYKSHHVSFGQHETENAAELKPTLDSEHQGKHDLPQ